MDQVYQDYVACRRIARQWARIALDNKRDGLPWHESAAQAHAALRWALLIIS
jgi:hypothetical protein